MFNEVASLRVFGLAVGLLIFAYFVASRRKYRSRDYDWPLLAGLGIPILGVSMFPSLVEIPRDLIFADSREGSKLDTVFVLAVIVLAAVSLRSRHQLSRTMERQNRLLSSLAVDRLAAARPDLPHGGIAVVIPAYNEADNLRSLVPAIPRQLTGTPVHVFVVDDGSSDGTAAVAAEHGAWVLEMPMNAGGGLALKSGFLLASRLRPEAVVTMDGDGQHLPSELPGLVEPILRNDADVVIGSRVLGRAARVSSMRTVGLFVFNTIISSLMGIRITDCASGYRAIRGRTLADLRLVQEQYHTAEMIIETAKRQYRITEVPITIADRGHGTTKKGHDLFYGVMFMRTIVKTWLR